MQHNSVVNFFEDQAQTGLWDSLYNPKNPKSYWFIVRLQKAIQLIDTFNNKTVLDLGCGTGVLIPFVLDNNGKYVGIDISENMLKEINRVHPQYVKNNNVKLILGDINKVQLQGDFDIIIGLGFIEYFDNPEEVVIKLYNSLSQKQNLILSFPNRLSMDYLSLCILAPLRNLMRVLFNKSTNQPRRKLWSVKKAKNIFLSAGFKNLKVVNYNVNIFAYPFTKISVSFTNFWAKLFENSFLSKFSFFATGFIIYGEK